MGVLVPLFKQKTRLEDMQLDNDQRLRVKLIHNSLEALKREEKAVEMIITEKCGDEIDRLNVIDSKMRQLEIELENICRTYNAKNPCPKR